MLDFSLISLTDESQDSPGSGSVSPKSAILPPTLKRVLSEKDKEGQSVPQSGGSPSKTTQDGGSQHFFEIVTVFMLINEKIFQLR